MALDIIRCSKCGTKIEEPADKPLEERQPCPKCGSTMRDKTIVISDSIKIGYAIAPSGPPPIPVTATVREDDIWNGVRTGLLGIWMTIYVTIYIAFVIASDDNSGFMNMWYASVAGLAGFGILLLLRVKRFRNGLFWYFDWVAGSEKKTTWRCFLVVLLFLLIFVVSLVGVMMGW
jgi:hypothetical protein